jgi:probable HAF family extracellular repeat protein
VAGYYIDGSGHYHGFVYSNGTYTTIDPVGSVFTDVMSINNLGQVTGYYEDSSGHYHGFLATPATSRHTASVTLTGVSVEQHLSDCHFL